MKKIFLFPLLLFVFTQSLAQNPLYDTERRPHVPEYRFELPDSLSHMIPWHPLPATPQPRHLFEESSEVPSTVLIFPSGYHPQRIYLPYSNVLRLGRVSISNGQAWNWGPYPDSYLDARTIIMPLP